MTIHEATGYLLKNMDLLNKQAIATRIKMDLPSLMRAIRGEKDAVGRSVKIPKRCLPELEEIIKELSV